MKALYIIFACLGLVVLYFRFKSLLFPPKQPAALRNFTLEELAKFDGEGGAEVYLSFDGYVFDVGSVDHYKKGLGGYAVYAGKECAWAITGSDLKGELTNRFKPDPNEKDLADVLHWLHFYKGKYPLMGYLVDDRGEKLGSPLPAQPREPAAPAADL